jgi:hypothetical protein
MTTGDRILRVSVATTIAFAVTAILGLVSSAARPIAAAVALAMFVGGSIGMLAALVVAAGRSRKNEIGIGGLFFLVGAAPGPVRRVLLGCFAAQVVVGLGTAIARPYSSAAFGVLAPVAGLAGSGLWGARYGEFGPRVKIDEFEPRT